MKRKKETRNRRLTDFMKKRREEARAPPPAPQPEKRASQEEVLEEILKIMGALSERAEEARPPEEVREEAKKGAEGVVIDEEMAKVLNNIEKIISDSNINILECASNKECSDGINVGELFVDKHGIRRQRGFLKTSRMPIYVDFIVENGEVEPVLRRAYVVKTSRGAMAIVPNSFLCELSARYGVLLSTEECVEEKGLFKKGM